MRKLLLLLVLFSPLARADLCANSTTHAWETCAAVPDLTTGAVTATGSTTARTMSARAADVVNVLDYGAKGDGTTNDAAAFSAAIARVNTLWTAGTPATLYLPAGRYYINSSLTQFAQYVPGRIQGAGMYQTYVVVGSGLSGNVFSWDETGMNGSSGTPTYDFTTIHNGGSIADLTMTANTGSGAQNAIVCLDRCDFFSLANVAVWNFNGSAFSVGTANLTAVAFMRESNIHNLRAWHDGSLTAPAINLSCVTDVPTGNSDCTNEVQFSQVNIYDPRCIGVAINDQSAIGTAHDIQFHLLRIEGGSRSTCDLLKIGDATASGAVHRIEIYGLEEFAVPTGAIGVNITGTSNNVDDILVVGHIASGPGKGVQIDVGKNITLRDMYFGSNLSRALTVAASTNILCCIRVEAMHGYPTLTIDATSNTYVMFGAGQGSGNYPPWHFDKSGNLTANTITTSATSAIAGTTAADEATAGTLGEAASIDCIIGAASDTTGTTITVTIATPAVVTWTSHTFTPSTSLANYTCPINFKTSISLPTGIVAGTNYWIIGSSVSGDTFQIADTAAHALAGTNAVNTSGTQSGVHKAYIGALGADGTTFVGAAMALLAGDWDCSSVSEYQELTAITSTRWIAAISTTAGVGATGTFTDNPTASGSIGGRNVSLPSPVVRQNISATTNVYALDQATFSGGTMNEGGRLYCRRMR